MPDKNQQKPDNARRFGFVRVDLDEQFDIINYINIS